MQKRGFYPTFLLFEPASLRKVLPTRHAVLLRGRLRKTMGRLGKTRGRLGKTRGREIKIWGRERKI